MNKQTKIIMGLLVLFMGILVGCPTEAPKEKKKGDDGGGDDPIANYTFISDYIDFHSYHVDIKNSTEASFNNAVFVVSTKSTPRALADIDDSAKVIRAFSPNQTRKISISWQDTFKTEYLYEAVADNKGTHDFVGGKYVPATDMDGNPNGTHKKRTEFIKLKTDTDYTSKKVAWILKENTRYYLHIYFNDGTDKTFTRRFTTASYPTSIDNITKKFGKNATVDAKNKDMKGVNFNAQPNLQEYRRSSFNPLISTHANSDNSQAILYQFGPDNSGGCIGPGSCNSAIGILIQFADKAILKGFADSDPAFSLLETMVIVANLYEAVAKETSESDENFRKRVDGLNSVLTSAKYGGQGSPDHDLDIISE